MPETKEAIYKPRDNFVNGLDKKYHLAAEQYFGKLTKDAGTNPAENEVHVKHYNELSAQVKKIEGKLGSAKGLKGFLIFLTVFFFVAAAVCIAIGVLDIVQAQGSLWFMFLIAAGCIGLAVLWIVLIKTSMKNRIAALNKELSEAKQKRDDMLSKCYADMASLNALFDWNMPAIVMERCTPIIDLDQYFSMGKYVYLRDKFGFNFDCDEDTSIVGVLSGNIHGNPFVLQKTFNNEFKPKKYEGELTITWTTTHSNGKGGTYTVTHTETLHAYAYHDAPHYSYLTKLIYGNEAAPDLSFSREPCGACGLNEKELQKFIDKKTKELQKRADKALKKGENFTKLGNDKFDALFNCTDRDNEVQFRLLFTPLAQVNFVSLIENPLPYGDDFSIYKRKKVNVVVSQHSQGFDYSADPELFVDYCYEASKARFIEYCDEFIKRLYFDLAPLMSIPMYQNHKSHEYIYDQDYGQNVPTAEHEVVANGMDKDCFMPDKADTSLPLVLKTRFLSRSGENDKVNVHSYSYETTPMTDYIPVRGRDGCIHNVPVHWTQYDRVDADNIFEVRNVGGTRSNYESWKASNGKDVASHYIRGLLGRVTNGGNNDDLDKNISSIFKKN